MNRFRSPVKSCHFLLDEPLFLWFVDGFWVVGADDGRVRWLPGRLPAAFGLICVVGAFVTEHVADEEHQSAQDGEDHHRNDTYKGHRYITWSFSHQQNVTEFIFKKTAS